MDIFFIAIYCLALCCSFFIKDAGIRELMITICFFILIILVVLVWVWLFSTAQV